MAFARAHIYYVAKTVLQMFKSLSGYLCMCVSVCIINYLGCKCVHPCVL